VANPKAPDFELDAPLREAAARWLNLVPAGHRRDSRESAKDVLATLRERTRSCPDHPVEALWVAHRHLRDPAPAVRIASLVLASKAPWWLGHFEDARRADLSGLRSVGRVIGNGAVSAPGSYVTISSAAWHRTMAR
jgi:hypothetical protein